MTNMYTFRQDEECKVCPSTGAQCINGIITNKPGFNSDLLLKFHTIAHRFLEVQHFKHTILSMFTKFRVLPKHNHRFNLHLVLHWALMSDLRQKLC